VILVAAWIALRQVREARRLREETHRPFVVVDVEADDFVFMLTVSNIGTSLARDVELSFDPPLESSIEHIDFSEIKMLTEGIATFAPGRVLRTLLDSATSRDQAKYPDVHYVRVTYADETRRRRLTKPRSSTLGFSGTCPRSGARASTMCTVSWRRSDARSKAGRLHWVVACES